MEKETEKLLDKTFILATVLVAVVILFLFVQMGYQQKMLEQKNTNQITVSGEGKIYAKPDVATVSFGVTAQASTVGDVTKSSTDKMNAIIAVIKQLGVADKDIQTTNYNLTPVYSNKIIIPMPAVPTNSGAVSSALPYIPATTGSVLTGYSLEQDVQVKIRDFTKIGDIMSAATTAGANIVNSLQFTVDNPDQYKNQAEANAIAAAKVNVQSLVKASGIQLGKLINIQENNVYYPMAFSANSLQIGGGAAAAAPSPTIQPGQQEIDETVNLTYQVQ